MRILLAVWLLLLLLLPGCSLLEGDAPEGDVPAEAATATPGVTPTVGATPQATEAAPQEQPPITIWVVDALSPAANVPGGSILAEQLAAYDTNNLDIKLDVEVKAADGQGSIINYLRSGRSVAPGILPDLIVLPVDRLAAAGAEGLIYPLDAIIAPADKEDLFPAAQSHSQVAGQMLGYPMTLNNLSHMVHSTSIFTQTVPLTWDAFVETEGVSFAFPGAGPAGAAMLLQLYLAEGGTLTNESNLPALQVEPLTAALTRFSNGRASGAIILESSGLTTLSESWQTLGSLANSVQSAESQYLVERIEGIDSAFAAIPGPQEPLAPLVGGWAWAVSAPDPARQAAAADVLNWLIAGPNIGDWSRAAGRLPARRSAFEQWPQGDDYTFFLQQELERAEPYPAAANSAMLDALGTALFDVLSLASSPEAAAQRAVAALRQ